MPLNWNFPAKIGPKTGKQVSATSEAIEKGEAILRYPPKYRPDLNSIEMPNSTFKEFPHSAERTIPGLYGAIASRQSISQLF
jgi:hypothetical protein